jgi:PAS domain S-box-containing protein
MNKILIVDDNPTIHEDIRKILCPPKVPGILSEVESSLFGAPSDEECNVQFQVDSAFQGLEGYNKVNQALTEGAPYAMAFVDVRMPPGWDGIETIAQIWDKYPDLQVVICTAYTDHSWSDITRILGRSDNFVILKKPFDDVELLQLAHALTKKWELNRQVQDRMAGLDEMVRTRTKELRASEERFQKAFQAVSVPMAILRSENQACVEVNDSFLALTARSRQEIVGASPAKLEQLIDPPDYERLLTRLENGGSVRDYNCRVHRNTNDVRETVISVEPVKLGSDECLLLALHDVTEQRQLELQLRHSQKMEAIGQLAAGIAHDFNNLLTIIQGHASIQLSRTGLDQQAADSFDHVAQAAHRAAALTRQLLAFSRKQVMQRRPLLLNETIARMQPMLLRIIGETITLECRCAPGLGPVVADEDTIEQLVMNLVVNAHDAMSTGGNLRITAEPVELDASAARRHPDARAGKFVRLSVADTGSGMDTTILVRIFEPFFTTKPKDKGTGLGLSTVYGIVKQHEGWVEVESKRNIGSTFSVFLPLCEHPANLPPESLSVAETLGPEPAGETILLVEDEAALREFIASALVEIGYKVLQAGDGPAAINVWHLAAQPIDLLLTDMIMPNGLTGAALAKRLLEKSSRLHVIYMSGYSPELVENADRLVEGVNFLSKPFDVSQLINAVRNCLKGKLASPLNTAGAAA